MGDFGELFDILNHAIHEFKAWKETQLIASLVVDNPTQSRGLIMRDKCKVALVLGRILIQLGIGMGLQEG